MQCTGEDVGWAIAKPASIQEYYDVLNTKFLECNLHYCDTVSLSVKFTFAIDSRVMNNGYGYIALIGTNTGVVYDLR